MSMRLMFICHGKLAHSVGVGTQKARLVVPLLPSPHVHSVFPNALERQKFPPTFP